MTNLEFLYLHDRRALVDFVSCDSHCDDCRARRYCDDFTGTDVPEWEFLVQDTLWDAGSPPGRHARA